MADSIRGQDANPTEDLDITCVQEAAGRALRLAIDQKVDLAALRLTDLKTCSPLIEKDIFPVLSLEGSLAARDHLGGTAPRQVREAVARGRLRLADLE